MHFGKYYLLLLTLIMGILGNAHAVPPVLNYAGQVAINGEAFDGNGLFKFALVNANGTTTYWSNDSTSVDGSEPQASVAVPVNGGLYSILLGNTAQQGMGAIDPAIFAQHTDAKLRVWFSDGVNGFQQLSPDRPFASVPYALVAEIAKIADVANSAKAVEAGAITKQMLGQDVLSDLNRTVTLQDLSPQIKADINATIGMNRLSTEVTEKLNQEKTTTNYNAPSVGSLLAVPYGSSAPAGYSLYQRGEPKELVWEEKAPVSEARHAFDGVEVLGGKIYFVGGRNGSGFKSIFERYNPITNTWKTLTSMTINNGSEASAALNGKLYVIGGHDAPNVEIYDPTSESWSNGQALPSEVNCGTAITISGKIYIIGGRNESNQNINQVLCFDPSTNQWTAKANMPVARHGAKLVWFENRIWAIGGSDGSSTNKVESYDPNSDSWRVETSLTTNRHWAVAWVDNGKIYVGGGHDGSSSLSSIEIYNPITKQWSNLWNFPEIKFFADAVVLNNKVYVVAGHNGSSYSNKVFAADLNASVEGVYDLYRKDGDAPVGTPVVQSEYADGSVTASKMAEGAVSKSALDATILKYLKPEITAQPQAQTVYADSNTSFSVTAEGKYLSYQWKKDGVDLTGETNATLNITDANATLHDGNYSVVVSNDFGSVESEAVEVKISDALLNGLVGWWKFDEGSGTVAYDSSGNGNDGNLTNGPTWTTGKIGGALSFDGANDYVYVPSIRSVNGSGVTFAVWIKPTHFDSIDYPHIISGAGVSFHGAGPAYISSNNKGRVGFYLVGGSSAVFTRVVPLLDWSHITAISNGTNYQIFWNGVLEQQSSQVTAQVGNSSIMIGSYPNPVNHTWLGFIDDVRIYDRALSAKEVQALYNLGQ